jgi:hypothetical protein
MRQAAIWGTVVILLHLLITIVHAAAHVQLHVDLNRPAMLFVVGVIVLCPLIALWLLWAMQTFAGLILLAGSMSASLVFGAYHHFYAAGPDQIGSYVSGFWPLAFTASAYGLAITEACGTYVSVHFLVWKK